MIIGPLRALSCAFVLLVAGVVGAQTPATPTPAAATGKRNEWPTLKDTDKERVLSLTGQFRKADPQLHQDAKTQLVALGEGAAPLLMQQVSDRAENSNPHLFAVLDELLKPQHAALIAREVKKPRIELRRYLVRRLCRMGDADMAGVLEPLQKDKDEQTAFFAQLGLLALKRREPLPAVMLYTKAHWAEVGPLIAEVLAPARSNEVASWVFESITKASATDQMTGLRLLRYLMVKEQGVILRTYLEASEHSVKREAINTARVLHGEAPIENLSVFQAIDHAKQWLSKI